MANLSKIKREKMLAYLEQLKAINNDDENIRAITEIENALNEKKYGLVWEEHSEKVDEMLEDNIPVFVEDESRKIVANEEEEYNFLLEGDNLHSLKLLEKTHKGKIDVIYIDPPYNTLKDGFTYSDTLVDQNDGFRHSKWLSFLNRRLLLAKELLSKNGIIYISIDEGEFAQLKLLCDSIFGEFSFVENFIWNKRVPKNDKGVGNIHEYILAYTNDSNSKYKLMAAKEGMTEIAQLIIKSKEEKKSIQDTELELRKLYKEKKYPRAITLYNNLDNDYRIFGKINMSWPNGNTFGPRYDVLHPLTNNPVKAPDRGWRWSKDTFDSSVDYSNIEKLADSSMICGGIWFSSKDDMQPSSIKYLEDVDRMLLRSIISLKSDGGMVLEEIFKKKSVFAYPKPVSLIKLLLDSTTYANKDCTILDFFAGSGTTGHAVAQLNKEDGGKRKYILCTNNENNICEEVTYQRLKNIQGDLPHNLKYYKTEFIPKFDAEESIADSMLEHIKELIELEHHIEIDDKKYIILDDEDEIESALGRVETGGKIFVASGVFLSRSDQRIIEEKAVSLIEIPEYYFREELREVGEL